MHIDENSQDKLVEEIKEGEDHTTKKSKNNVASIKPKKLKGSKASSTLLSKRERNRISAQESRYRKKNFVNHLEEKIKQLEDQVKRQQIIIESQNNLLKLQKYSQHEFIQELSQGRMKQYEQLQYLLENQCSCDEIENQVEAINIRHGTYSRDRKMILNSLFKLIIENILPISAKHLLFAAEESEVAKQEEIAEKPRKLTKYQLKEFVETQNLDEWEEDS